MRSKSLLIVVLGTFVLASSGCGLFGDESGGRVVVRLTDAPIEAEAITVSIVAFTLIDSESGEQETVPLEPAADGINLLDYQDGLTLLVAAADVSISQFDQFRLRIGDTPKITIDSVEEDIHVASGASSGIKFFLDEPLALNGDTFDVTLDFDAQESVVPTGPPSAPTGYVMTPVIRPVNATLNDVQLSISEGVLEDELAP